MSLTKYIVQTLLLAAVSLSPREGLVQEPNASREVSCPAVLESIDTAGSVKDWSAENARMRRPVLRISVLQKSAVGEEYDLAPDSTSNHGNVYQQIWSVPHNTELKTYLRCRYKNTDTTLLTELGVSIRQCEFKFTADAHGTVLDPKQIRCF
jgi:hypothetical protein